jgi:hypothetical protein
MALEPFLVDEDALETLISRWRDGSLPGPEFTHAAHLAACAWLSFEYHGEELVQEMKRLLIWFNKVVGTPNSPDRGYHETLTRFWCVRVEEAVAGNVTRLAAARTAVAMYGDDRLATDRYYSFDVLKSREARKRWIAPDMPQPKADAKDRRD